jgi:hypothetical protein
MDHAGATVAFPPARKLPGGRFGRLPAVSAGRCIVDAGRKAEAAAAGGRTSNVRVAARLHAANGTDRATLVRHSGFARAGRTWSVLRVSQIGIGERSSAMIGLERP